MQDKIYPNIKDFLDEQKQDLADKTLVFTNGCFDILHPGHLHYLAAAKSKGDLLVVGINSDASVQRLKGENRPINEISYRCQMLAGLSSVDYVVIFEEDTPKEIIEEISPQILVKGADYTIDTVVGAKFVQSKGGEVILIPFLEGYSTSKWLDALNKKAK